VNLSVDIFAGSGLEHRNHLPSVVDFADDSIAADTQTPTVAAVQFSAPTRTRVVRERTSFALT
jgi:hypothetical protein